MFENKIQRCIQESCKELLESKNVELQKRLKYAKQKGYDTIPEFYESFIENTILQMMHVEETNMTEEEIIMLLDDHLAYFDLMTHKVRIKVEMENQETTMYRELVVPYAFKLSELAYTVLATFEADASHLYKVVFEGDDYFGEYQDETVFEFGGDFANETFLFELDLEEGSIIEVNYDYGDNYWFTVKVMDIEEHNTVMTIADIEITDGKGYGIWEDNHGLLEVFLDDEEHFPEYAEKEGFELDWFNTEEKFDIETSNETFIEKFLYIVGAYNQEDDDE